MVTRYAANAATTTPTPTNCPRIRSTLVAPCRSSPSTRLGLCSCFSRVDMSRDRACRRTDLIMAIRRHKKEPSTHRHNPAGRRWRSPYDALGQEPEVCRSRITARMLRGIHLPFTQSIEEPSHVRIARSDGIERASKYVPSSRRLSSIASWASSFSTSVSPELPRDRPRAPHQDAPDRPGICRGSTGCLDHREISAWALSKSHSAGPTLPPARSRSAVRENATA